jgi:dephospho-CoA kinase
MKKKTIIGIIGEQAGGKGAVSDIIIKKFGGSRLTTSNILRRTLDSLHIKFSRENLITLALSLKKGLGDPVLMEAMLKDIEKIDSDLVIVDGIRMHGDTDPFIREYGDDFHLIYVTANQKLRYERSKGRGEKSGESEASFEEFASKEEMATEKSISEIGKTADFIIENNEGYKELTEKVMKIMNKI